MKIKVHARRTSRIARKGREGGNNHQSNQAAVFSFLVSTLNVLAD